MLLSKLKQRFTRAIDMLPEGTGKQDFFWITNEEGRIGIPKEDLSLDEMELLHLLFHESPEILLNRTASQLAWNAFLLKGGPLPLTSWHSVRFIHFHNHNPNVSSPEFEEAIASFFQEDALLIWEDHQTGCILEKADKDMISIEAMKEAVLVMESDFYSGIHLYAGSRRPLEDSLRKHSAMERKIFNEARLQSPERTVHDIRSSFPYMMLKGFDGESSWYKEQLLGEMADDKEMIRTIRTYIRLNRNATMAAKELYVHRNSLQYRIDKFIEKTGLDIRNFYDAMIAYLAITIL